VRSYFAMLTCLKLVRLHVMTLSLCSDECHSLVICNFIPSQATIIHTAKRPAPTCKTCRWLSVQHKQDQVSTFRFDRLEVWRSSCRSTDSMQPLQTRPGSRKQDNLRCMRRQLPSRTSLSHDDCYHGKLSRRAPRPNMREQVHASAAQSYDFWELFTLSSLMTCCGR
jgi:hypothetical protein